LHPRVRVNPHASAESDGVARRNDALFLDNLARYSRGEPPLYLRDQPEVTGGKA
jgi:hypothetical protein